jgi:membrane associated rhomboid family serine protease
MPQRDTYRPPAAGFSVMPPIIKNLLILNGLLFLAQFVAAETLPPSSLMPRVLDFLVLHPPGVEETFFLQGPDQVGFWPWQLVTYGFLHAGFWHIFFNMFILWMFGMQIENTWGSKRFAIFYFVCIIGAGITHLSFVDSPVIGASGAVFGVMLAFAMMFPDRPIYLYFLFPVKAKWLMLGLGALELFYGFSGAQGNVANFAHLGGMVCGFVAIQYWRGKLPIKPDRVMRW